RIDLHRHRSAALYAVGGVGGEGSEALRAVHRIRSVSRDPPLAYHPLAYHTPRGEKSGPTPYTPYPIPHTPPSGPGAGGVTAVAVDQVPVVAELAGVDDAVAAVGGLAVGAAGVGGGVGVRRAVVALLDPGLDEAVAADRVLAGVGAGVGVGGVAVI